MKGRRRGGEGRSVGCLEGKKEEEGRKGGF